MPTDPSPIPITSAEVAALRDETRAMWDTNATFWDAGQGDEGNQTQRMLVGPTTERLLALRAGEEVLDLACGTGTMARRMAQLGARVLAADQSGGMLERARARSEPYADRIEYRQVDATDEAQLLALGEGRFDAAVCLQALMDMPVIQPALDALARLVKPTGRAVISVSHPCFNGTDVRRSLSEEDQDGVIVERYSVTISHYITPTVARGQGMVGQPTPHYGFDRPLSVLFGACFKAGFVLDALEEPTYDDAATAQRWFSWTNFKEIPHVLIARLRVANQPEKPA